MAAIPSALQYETVPAFRSVDLALTLKRQELREDRKSRNREFNEGLTQLFDELKQSPDKATARRGIEIHVLAGIDGFLRDLPIPENTKEDVERISLRLLGLVTCFGWEAYDRVIEAISQEYSWRQAKSGARWAMPESVTLKMADIKAKKQATEKPASASCRSIHPNGKAHKLTRAEIERNRKENREKRLKAQPAKGSTNGGGNNHGQKGSKGKKGKGKK